MNYEFRINFSKLVKKLVLDSEILISGIDLVLTKKWTVKKLKAKCPDCDAELEAPEDVMLGEILSCPDCGLELEVKEINGDGLELQELTIEGEDWGE